MYTWNTNGEYKTAQCIQVFNTHRSYSYVTKVTGDDNVTNVQRCSIRQVSLYVMAVGEGV